jgi:ABC-type transport system involved in multi-copper enzyme maturation permease subunit
MSWLLGPIFVYEWQRAARRWQMYASRVVFLGALLAALALVWEMKHVDDIPLRSARMAEIGASFYYAVIGTLLALILMMAPAATAGALCIDKSRGILLPLLATQLSDAEIVVGKLAARMMPVLGLIAGSMPVLFLCTFLGGIQPNILLNAYLVAFGTAFISGALGLLLSVWAARMYEALLATYAVIAAALLIVPVWLAFWPATLPPPRVLAANPFWLAFAPYQHQGAVHTKEPGHFLLCCFLLATECVLIAILRMRSVATRQAGADGRPRGDCTAHRHVRWERAWHDRWPVLWLEWCRRQPALWVRVLWRFHLVLASVLSVVAIIYDFRDDKSDLAAVICGGQVWFGLLLVSVISVTVLAEERVRGSLDILLTTPLSSRAIVQGKWWGSYRTVLMLTIWPGVTALVLATRHGLFLHALCLAPLVLAYGAAITSVGLTLATWVARFSHAVVLSVAIYAVVSLVWSVLMVTMFYGGTEPMREFGWFLAVGSPWFGVAQVIAVLQDGKRHFATCLAAELMWIVTYTLAAHQLYTRLGRGWFDYCLGRVRADYS